MNTHFNVTDQELAAANGGLADGYSATKAIFSFAANRIQKFGEELLEGVQKHYAAKGPLC